MFGEIFVCYLALCDQINLVLFGAVPAKFFFFFFIAVTFVYMNKLRQVAISSRFFVSWFSCFENWQREMGLCVIIFFPQVKQEVMDY